MVSEPGFEQWREGSPWFFDFLAARLAACAQTQAEIGQALAFANKKRRDRLAQQATALEAEIRTLTDIQLLNFEEVEEILRNEQ